MNKIARSLLGFISKRLKVEIQRAPDDLKLHLYQPNDRTAKPFYNVGSGSFWHPYWRNLDFVSEHYRGVQKEVVDYNLMSLEPLPIESATAKIIYTSHTIEHVNDRAVENLFLEALRCLMTGGVFRVTTGPDADTDFSAMMRGDTEWFYWDKWYSAPGTYEDTYREPADSRPIEERWLHHVASQLAPNNLTPSRKFSAEEIREIVSTRPMDEALDYFTSLCQFHPERPGNHVSWWNAEKIIDLMRRAGFTNVWRSGYNQSSSPLLRHSRLFDSTHPQISVYVEAIR